MPDSKLEVPAEIRELVEKTIEQSDKAFALFFGAAFAGAPPSGRSALGLAERNFKATLEHARQLARAEDIQQAVSLQADFLRTQIANAGEFMRAVPGDRES